MEQKDKENYREPIVEDEAAGSEDPPDVPANGRLLVKLKLPKMPEEEEEEEEKVVEEVAAAAAAAEICPVEEIKSHYCKECNKSFSSGKALGGHMSSAHVQANKDHSFKKLNSRMKRQPKGAGSSSGSAGDNTCMLCGKDFPSKKSLFGHMRCHPERDWRGMEPPAYKKMESPEASSEPELEDVGPNQDGDEEDQIDSGPDVVGPTADVGRTLESSWATKRGRGLNHPIHGPPVSSSEEKEAVLAVHQLMRLLKGEPGKQQKLGTVEGMSSNPYPLARHEGPQFDAGDHSKKQKRDSDPVQFRSKIANNGKGKEKHDYKGNAQAKDALFLQPENSLSTVSLPDDIDSDEKLYLTAIGVLMSGKQDKIDNQKRIHVEQKFKPTDSKTAAGISHTQQKPKRDSGTSHASTPEKYICSICNRSFPTHQALGGHRSSHNKFKMSIFNTIDRRHRSNTAAVKEKRDPTANNIVVTNNLAVNLESESQQSKEDRHAKIVTSNVADDNIKTAEKVVLDFDLNMTPEEEYDDSCGVHNNKDVAGDPSNHTSNS